ncbi:diacylglycerol kinase family protein [Nocardioides sp. Root151]|uniref:diacylglycerol kinase family protein n=1 Tax=Nocardioides sp. Root151 TaxID=1736475 RepID=UPI000703A6C3|nr:diacylglycerol kinase family protein [Nocardioides sp. Root151]KQZ76099.1 PA-phosphatase [Nocardioides sp. Root151]
MIDRPRAIILSWSALCFGLFVLITVLVTNAWGPLHELDHDVTRSAAEWTRDRGALPDVLHVLELATGTIASAVATLLVGVLLWVKGHHRAGLYVVGVVALTMASVHTLKWVVDRDRPKWWVPEEQLTNGSFPSGHASYAAAIGGALIVISVMLVRRRGLRHLTVWALVLAFLLICADRLLLGRHFPSDLAAGLLLGAGFVLLGLAFYSPLPKSTALTTAPLVASVPASSRDLHVVLNPIKVEDVGQFRAIVSSMAREAGWSEPSWHYTTVEDPGTGMAHAASVSGADLVIVCGGDGTVREVCAELAGTGIPVGIIPAGTGNLLARNLDIPLYIRSAIDVALNGQDRAIDMVEVSGDGIEDSHFMVMAGMGFDAAIMEGVNEDIKKRVGWLAYVLSALKSLMFPAVKVEVSVDDGPATVHRARTVLVGNVGFLQAGMPLLPDALIDDGVLDVVLLHPKKFLSWIPLAIRVLTKRSKTDETIERFTGRKVVVRAAADTPRQLDGDSIGSGRELVMECIHGRLLVRVPR